MSGLPKTYDPGALEPALYAWWEQREFFHARPDPDAPDPFCIMLPLPNVTGALHIGHALNHSAQDTLIRRARMQGRATLWQPGTDHAGIATQNVVERQLAQEGRSRHDLGREAFIERVWRWRDEAGETILAQMRRLGASCDWRRAVFTLDPHYVDAVRKVFCDWYDDGLIYRGYRLINWCPRCATALSDIEVDHAEVPGELAYIRYRAADGGDGVVVATTRAETMLGDTAVAVHPDDERYRALVGTTVILPLLDRPIPVIADPDVDPEFGTGTLKITPAHDPTDHLIGQRHDLPMIDVFNDDATVNEQGGPYAGLDRFAARERVKADLAARGLLVRVEQRPHSVGHCSRCGTVVEPRLSDQWFVAVRRLAAPAVEAVQDGRTTFVPERNAKGFIDWLRNLHDWCISRQLWWGHRIPAWYDADGGVHVYRQDPDADEIARLGLVRQDADVLDTWFSSQLWPFVTLGWPDDTPELATWYPGTALVTGYDINTFWVSRMLMAGLYFTGDVPFGTVVNTGLVRDAAGKKMSKSFGNVIDPLALIDRYGADALRFALLRAAPPGQDVPLAEEWVEGGRRFANKLWNAARLVLARADGTRPVDGLPAPEDRQLEDRWILSRLERARAEADAAYEGFDIAPAARALYHFVWDDFCDWYLELAKLRDDRACRQVLVTVLDVSLRLLHPVVPFVTDTIWRALVGAADDASIMCGPWPTPMDTLDEDAEAAFRTVAEVVTGLRQFRAEHDLAPAARISVRAVAGTGQRAVLEAGLGGLCRLAGVADWAFVDAAPVEAAGKVLVSGAELYVPLAGTVDLDEERRRLQRELERARDERERATGKLANDSFVTRAPTAVVQAERDKVAAWEATAEQLRAQLEELEQAR